MLFLGLTATRWERGWLGETRGRSISRGHKPRCSWWRWETIAKPLNSVAKGMQRRSKKGCWESCPSCCWRRISDLMHHEGKNIDGSMLSGNEKAVTTWAPYGKTEYWWVGVAWNEKAVAVEIVCDFEDKWFVKFAQNTSARDAQLVELWAILKLRWLLVHLESNSYLSILSGLLMFRSQDNLPNRCSALFRILESCGPEIGW